MSKESKKRRRSHQESEENQVDAKRIKTEPEDLLSVCGELSESHSVKKKKKKHRHHQTEVDETAEYIKDDSPHLLQEDALSRNSLLEGDFENNKSGRKHKHRKHHQNDVAVESVDTSIMQDLETADTEGANRLQQMTIEKSSSHKKKKKHRHREENEYLIKSEEALKQELIIPSDDDYVTNTTGIKMLDSPAVDESGVESSVLGQKCEEGKKKKKKKKKHHSQDYADEDVVQMKCEGTESPLPVSAAGTTLPSMNKSQGKSVYTYQQAETSRLLSADEHRCERLRPLQLHTSTENLRFEVLLYLVL